MPKIAVVGLGDFTKDYLADSVKPDSEVEFVSALSRAETLITEETYPFEERLDLATRRAEEAQADGIITHWDFPSSLITPFVAKRLALPYTSVESVMKCEHKYWFRREQDAVADAPAYCAFDPFDDDPLSQVTLDFPFWIKPVVGHSSMLGFEITCRSDFDAALAEIRRDIERLTEPFRYPLTHADLPHDLAERGATLCLAEDLISAGDQYTVEGYADGDEVVVYGIVASIREPNGHSFARYQYPASLDREAAQRMEDVTCRIVRQIGYGGCPFNLEFFHEPQSGRIHVLEMNSRLSQSHSDLFRKVDGQPHQRVAVDLALGRTPEWRRGGGPFAIAAKHFVRHYEDGVVKAVPDEAALRQIAEEMPDVRVALNVSVGQRLSELLEQDSYSYELADVFIGAQDEDELLRKYERCLEILTFEID